MFDCTVFVCLLRVQHFDISDDVFVKKTGSYIWANEVWGALRGLETFSQLVFRGTDGVVSILADTSILANTFSVQEDR